MAPVGVEMSAVAHEPVLLNEVLEWLNPRPGDRFVDCTAGCGGHTEAILERLGPAGKLIAIDRDPDAILSCKERLGRFGKSLVLVCDNYRNLARVAESCGIASVQGILIDCGVSSAQLESASRGFSFQNPGPLDMRMDPHQPWKLEDFLRRTSEEELAHTLTEYGEERYAWRIARAIKKRLGHIRDTGDLAEAIRASVPPTYRYGRIHPATRTFQALRIRVNDELGSLEEALRAGLRILAPGARMAAIAFHSLEDRIVKRFFREMGKEGAGKALTRKPIRPGAEETQTNPRSRSARLRVFEAGGRS